MALAMGPMPGLLNLSDRTTFLKVTMLQRNVYGAPSPLRLHPAPISFAAEGPLTHARCDCAKYCGGHYGTSGEAKRIEIWGGLVFNGLARDRLRSQ